MMSTRQHLGGEMDHDSRTRTMTPMEAQAGMKSIEHEIQSHLDSIASLRAEALTQYMGDAGVSGQDARLWLQKYGANEDEARTALAAVIRQRRAARSSGPGCTR